ncbi:DUF805 domain-containing protein [Bifidobacterium avesanii]|uniref:DUF805 domain-containing protein n=1 Tax=Bifidobacterium avesanii TaxID=1798157 RepID=A0A7K3TI23_9BIFI|nr:DUF805 domain-containing protein [Bifidobacterium avesanii]KAB8287383.1 hypothetical protein DSM100685_1902 [Bifidobacterium avesanii]NEG78702.1 DUF805 domain-containing protein [Bifidobacterium avesanii]
MTDSQPTGTPSNDGQQPTPQYGQYTGQYANPQQPAQQPAVPQQPQYGQQAQQPAAYGQYTAGQYTPQQPQQTPQYGQYAATQQPAPAQQPQYAQPGYGQYAPQGQNPYGQPAQPVQSAAPAQPANAPYGQYGQQAPANPFAAGYQQPQPAQPQYAQPQYAQPNPYAQPAPGQPLPQGAPAQAYMGEPPIDQPWYGIKFGAAIKRLFRKAFVHTGRASRGEFWWALLFIGLLSVAITLITTPLGSVGTIIGYVWQIISYVLVLFVGIRRLHDTNRSGWFMLLPIGADVLDTVIGLIYEEPINDMIAYGGIEASAGTMGIIIGTAIVIIVATIVGIVMLAGRSKPEGARFDVRA